MTKLARLLTRNVQPKFTHDCADCRFLGRLDGEDLYLCEQPTPAYLRRFGNAPQQNASLGMLAPQGSAYSLAQQIIQRKLPPNEYRTK